MPPSIAKPSTDPKLKTIKPHAVYYHQGGDFSIIIDDTAFLVASYFFTTGSPVFAERFSAQNQNTNSSTTNAQEKLPIVIQPEEGVTPDDFSKLCWVFYNEKISIYDAPLETWKTILRLSNQYKFAGVKELAFRELSKPNAFTLTLVERIVLYREYDAPQDCLEQLYMNLLSRPEPLTIDEGNALGLTSALLISGARERLRAASDRLSLSDALPTTMTATIQAMVGSIFWNGPAPDLSHLAPSTNSLSTVVPSTSKPTSSQKPLANGRPGTR